MAVYHDLDRYHDDYLHLEIDGEAYVFIDLDDYYDYLKPIEE